MTPTIDDIEAALPHVPAGLHCGDLTEPGERRAFAVTVHEIVVRASTGHTAPNPAPLVEWGVDEARVNWGPPKPGTHESDLNVPLGPWIAGLPGSGGDADWCDAADWSQENAR